MTLKVKPKFIDSDMATDAELALGLADKADLTFVESGLLGKVDVVAGKQLSTEDYTTTEKNKLAGIANGATANSTDAALRTRSTHTGNESTLTWDEVSTPSAPSLGVTTYSKAVGGRQMYAQIGKSGVDYSFQPFIARNRVILHQAIGNATTISSWGAAAPTGTGTVTTRNVAITNLFSWMRRVGFVSATTNNSSCGLRSAVLQFGLGNIARAGGFHFVTRFGISDAVLNTGARLFVGITSTTLAFAGVDPSTLTNIIGVGIDAADTTLQIIHNDGAGSATKIDLGANFPESTNTDMYELALYCPPNGSVVFYSVINLTTNSEAGGSITTNLPLNTQLLTWQLWRNNVATGLAVGLDVASVYLETDN